MTQINLLAVSVGNTRTRVGAFVKGDLCEVSTFRNDRLDRIASAIEQADKPLQGAEDVHVLMSSVNPAVAEKVQELLKKTLAREVYRVEQDLPIPIVHEDEALIVVSKPVDLIIHPGGATKTGTLVNGLLHRYPELAVVGRADRPGIVHRLDRDTSGVMVVARTNEAAQSLVRQFKAKTVQKEYAALVWGVPPFDSDWIDLPIGPRKNKPHLRQVVREGGQPASTFYEVRERLGVASHLAAYPRTGRTHQIRVHLDHIGFPILGDGQYGGQKRVQYERWCTAREKAGQAAPTLSRQALHARKLTFEHPLSGEQVTFEAPLPEDMVRALELLRTIDD